VLVGHSRPSATASTIAMSSMATFFYANPVDALFQGEGNVALYGNLFVNPYGNAIHIQSHNDIP